MLKQNQKFLSKFHLLQNTPFSLHKLCFAENTLELVFSAEHSFCGSQLVNSLLETLSKNTLFAPQKWFFGVYPVSAETPIFVVLSDSYTNLKRTILPKLIVLTAMPFSPFQAHKSLHFPKKPFLDKNEACFHPTQEPHYFCFLFFAIFPFLLLSSFVFVFLQHKKEKCQVLFENLVVLIPTIFETHYIGTPFTLSVTLNIPPKQYKIGETKQNKSWTRYWRNTWTRYWLKKPKSWTRYWLYISIYIMVNERARSIANQWASPCVCITMLYGAINVRAAILLVRWISALLSNTWKRATCNN